MRLNGRSRWGIGGALLLAAACSSSDSESPSGAGGFGGVSGTGGATGFGSGGGAAVACNNNNVIDPGEECDGNALGGATCGSVTLGAQPLGNVTCNACKLDHTQCSGGSAGNTGAGGQVIGAGGALGSAGAPVGGAANGSGGTPASSGGTASSSGGSNAGSGETGRMVGMTDAINQVRHNASNPTPATPLPDMTWSADIAATAQAYANTLASQGCNLVHSHTPGLGENLAEFGGQQATPAQAVQLWASEGACYNFGPITASDSCPCALGGACGHYTQLVWRGTTQVGCGVASCANSEVWVCNFKPPGNYIGQTPY